MLDSMRQKPVIFDIDGTLANNDHRQHLITGFTPDQDWDRFFAGLDQDEPYPDIIYLSNLLWNQGHRIVLMTGRPERWRFDTIKWLTLHGVAYDHMLMRGDNDHRCDTIVKREMFERSFSSPSEVLFVVDDRNKVVDMWRELGLRVLHCQPGDF